MFESILAWLEQLSRTISLELFVVVGAFLEEIIAPIPSPFVMTIAAVLAQEQAYGFAALAWIIVLGAIAKTFSTYIVYVVSDKAEDIVVARFGKYVGLDHSQIEKIGRFFKGTWWDDVLLFLARAIPIIPTFPVSVAAGVIKYHVRGYLLATFLGSIVRNIFYLWIGYFGYEQLHQMWNAFQDNPIMLGVCVVMILLAIYAALKLKDYTYEAALNSKTKQDDKS